MSRGGRGGRGGGRAKAGMARIGGIDIAYDEALEESMKQRPQPTPLFPTYHPNQPAPLSQFEEVYVRHTLSLRERMRRGPLYSTLAPTANPGGPVAVNPFEQMGSYSDRYKVFPKRLPDLKAHWAVEKKKRTRTEAGEGRFFPRELWKVIGLDGGEDGARKKIKKEKRSGLTELNEGEEEDEEAPGEKKEDGEDEEGEVQDDEYVTDEEDMGGDYNAEQYFDDGDDDGDDGGDGGGEEYS